MFNILKKIKSIPKFIWIIMAIMAVGIFLRTYHYHDWLRFSKDQGRDATVIENIINRNNSLPLLGPKAGGTNFKLGPIFYYFQVISAKLFGNYPDKIAYPDLLWSILCIPLVYFFLHKYFNLKTSLLLTALFSVSSYAVQYSRFAWNQNSIPFWTVLSLYAIHNVISQKNQRKLVWSAIAGLAIGVGVQMHTTLLLFLPITTIIVFGFLLVKRVNLMKYFFIILIVSLFLNAPQFVSEYRTHGQNFKDFFSGVQTKPQEGKGLQKNILHSSACWIQGNIYIVSGYNISDKCKIKTNSKKTDLVVFIAGIIFVLGGTILGLNYLWREKNQDRKYFLIIVFVYIVITYLVFVPLAYSITMRFFLVIFFLPFIFLGFWMKFLQEKIRIGKSVYLPFIIVLLLIATNVFYVKNYFTDFVNFEKGKNAKKNIHVTTLKELEGVSQFIVANSNGSKEVYIRGNRQYLLKSMTSLQFLVSKSNIKLIPVEKNTENKKPLFYVDSVKATKKILKSNVDNIIRYHSYGRFLVLLDK